MRSTARAAAGRGERDGRDGEREPAEDPPASAAPRSQGD